MKSINRVFGYENINKISIINIYFINKIKYSGKKSIIIGILIVENRSIMLNLDRKSVV